MNDPSGSIFEFGSFRLDPDNHLLLRDGNEVPLSGRAFDVLLLLVQRPGALITKEELMSSVWSGSFVEDSNLTVAISTLRRALSENTQDPRYIQTVSRRGYRFIAEVHTHQGFTSAVVGKTDETTVANEMQSPTPSLSQQWPTESKYQTSRLQSRLRFWSSAAAVAGLLVALIVCGWFLLKPRQPIQTLAVLPFTVDGTTSNRSTVATAPSEFMLLGMTDDMISLLDSELVVRPTSSVLRYSDATPVDPVVAGREQDVDAVLTGMLDSSSGRTILKLRLIRTRNGSTLWRSSFQSASNNLPQLEQDAGNAAAHELHILSAVSTRTQTVTSSNPVLIRANNPAYQYYLIGRYFWNRRTVDGLRKSADYFRQSIDADPNYAPAYAGLADAYALLASFSVEPGRSSNADARSAAFSAIHLDPTLAEPHASLGMIYFFTDWNLTAAQQEFEQAIRLNPNYATAHHWYALDLAAMGRPAQALYEIHQAQKLDPLSLIIGTNVGWIEYLAHDYSASIRDLHRVLELDPNFVRARTRLGIVEMATGDYVAAMADLARALTLSGDEDPWVEGLLGDAEALAGNRAAAEQVLAELQKRSSSQYVPPISRALVLLGLGYKAKAVVALQQAVDDHSTSMVYARVDPSLDPLRSDSSFQALLAHIKI